MPAPQPILAAVDWIQIVIFLFIVISSLVGQVVKAFQDRKKGQAPRRPLKPPVPPAPDVAVGGRPQPVRPAPPKKRPLEEEIEAFLRGVTSEKAPSKPPTQVAKSNRPPVRAEVKPRPPAPRRRPSPATSDSDFPSGENVEQHVRKHLIQGGLQQRDSHLGELIGQSDERIESHLKDVFDHGVGQLDRQPTGGRIAEGTDAAAWDERTGAVSPLATQLHQMLANPEGLRSAIVLAEILRRPGT